MRTDHRTPAATREDRARDCRSRTVALLAAALAARLRSATRRLPGAPAGRPSHC